MFDDIMLGLTLLSMITTLIGERRVSKYSLLTWQFITLMWITVSILRK